MASHGTASAIGSITGTLIQAYGAVQQGRTAAIAGQMALDAAEFNANMLEFSAREAARQGGRVVAISQRQAAEERRQGRLAASRALAVAAASGGGVSDPTIIDLIARTEGEAYYRANVALYEGEAEERRLRFEALLGRGAAAQARIGGQAALAAGQGRRAAFNLAALGRVFEGGASLYAKYGGRGPGKGDTALIGSYPGETFT